MKRVQIVRTQDANIFEKTIAILINKYKNCNIQFSTGITAGYLCYCALLIWEDNE